MSAGRFVSEAPVACEVVAVEGGGWALERRLDPAFGASPRAREAFLSEVEAAATTRGSSGSLARVLVADGGPEPRLVREYRPEGTLRDLLAAGAPVPAPFVLSVVAGLAEALDALHRAGVVHGDPAPENVLLRNEGGVALADPRSSRRALVLSRAERTFEDEARADRAVLLSIARRLLGLGGGEPSPLATEVAAILDVAWEPERKVAALLRHAPSPPVPGPQVGPGARGEIPFPIPVTVVVAPVRDPRARHAVARVCAAATGATPGSAAQALESAGLAVPSTFPVPSRSLVEALRGAGASVSVRSAQKSSPPAPKTEA